MNRETIIQRMREIDLIDFRDEDEDEHVAELVEKVASIVAMAVAKESEFRKAAQAENADLKERLARSGIEQRRAVAKEREECAKVCDERAMLHYKNVTEDELERCAADIRARGENV